MAAARGALGTRRVANPQHGETSRDSGTVGAGLQSRAGTGMRAKEDPFARVVHQSEGTLEGGIGGKSLKELVHKTSSDGRKHLGAAGAAPR
eukprot:15431011-Alexandrium_andersonii.AAC.1